MSNSLSISVSLGPRTHPSDGNSEVQDKEHTAAMVRLDIDESYETVTAMQNN